MPKNCRKLAFLLASLFALFTFTGCVSIAKLMGRKLKMSDITKKINTDNMKAMDFAGKIMTEGFYTKGGQGNAGVAFAFTNSLDGKNFNVEYQPKVETDEEFLKNQFSDMEADEQAKAVEMYKKMLTNLNDIKGGIYKRDNNILIDLKPFKKLFSTTTDDNSTTTDDNEGSDEEGEGFIAGVAKIIKNISEILKKGDYVSLPAKETVNGNEFLEVFKEPLEKIKKMGDLIPDYEFKYMDYGKDYIEFKGRKSEIMEEIKGVKAALEQAPGGKEFAYEIFGDGLEDTDPKNDGLLNFKIVFSDGNMQITFDTISVTPEKKAKISGVINTRPSQEGTEFKKLEGNIIDLGAILGGIGSPVNDDEEDYEDYDDSEDAEKDDDIVIMD